MFSCESFVQLVWVNLILRVLPLRRGRVIIGWNSWIKCGTSIDIGTGTGWGFRVRGSGRLTIGKYCAIGENVSVITSNHEMAALGINFLLQDRIIGRRLISEKLDVTIGHDVWIGDRAIILPGIKVGNGAVIAAGSVVASHVKPYEVVGGNPAKPIRMRFPEEMVAAIQALAWWDWPEEKLRAKKSLFIDPVGTYQSGRWPGPNQP